MIRRTEVRPFTDKQIKLLETFASQAVIAIENVRLFNELDTRNRQLTEALEQQTATSEILRVIASSPTDIQPVLNTVAESAARLCDAVDVQIWRVDGERVRFAAHYGSIPIPKVEEGRPIIRGVAGGRAILDREIVHVPDTLAPNVQTEFREAWSFTQESGTRTLLAAPLLREGTALGYILIRRFEARPFSDNQIALLKTFADQAVIAIENVRLFQELKELLEQQTATSEILGVIASSPTDVQPVLDVVTENAARLCDADDAQIFRSDGDLIRLAANYGGTPATQVRSISRGSVMGRIFVDRKTLHIHDLAALVDTEFPEARESLQRSGQRTYLGTPLLREGVSLGAIGLRRKGVRPFTDRQVKLLETFASQAVIAIENVRLFNELDTRNRQLTEALEQQTATSEILRVIASSPTDIQPVLDVVAESAARLCEASDANIYRMDGAGYRLVASFGSMPIPDRDKPRPLIRGLPPGRAMIDRAVVHVADMMSPQAQAEFPESRTFTQAAGLRTLLVAPLLREGVAIGAIFIRRTRSPPFYRKADRTAQNLRRPSGNRHRERAAVPRIAGTDA